MDKVDKDLNYDVVLDKQAIKEIMEDAVKDIGLASSVDVRRIDQPTYQVLLTLRALERYLERRNVQPQFLVVTEEYARRKRKKK